VVISAKTDDKSTKADDNYEANYVALMDVLLSQWPYGYLNQETSYQVLHLTNLTTCECSWEVMVRGSKESLEIINLILTKNTDGECRQFTDKETIFKAAYDDFGLNKSQSDAVASCISATKCSKNSSVHLIWGPPGTGKTKTISVILHMLLMVASKHRTLVCAPTNTTLVQLASHLVSLVETSTETSYLLGDIIMLGSDKLMKKTDNDLSKIFLKYRVAEMSKKSYKNHRELEDSCLRAAKLVFCTPCMSSRLKNQQYDILVIDEAANLKECESMIPLAMDGIKHVVLIRDDKQLQSMVMSPVCLCYKTI
jgi:type I site-specific restriction endonuclease